MRPEALPGVGGSLEFHSGRGSDPGAAGRPGNPGGAATCVRRITHPGAAAYPPPPPAPCPNYGALLLAGAAFCTACGLAANAPQLPSWTTPAAPAPELARPTPARPNSTPVLVGLGLIGLVAVVIAGAVLFSTGSGPHATFAPSAIALGTEATAPTLTAAPTLAPTPTPDIVDVTPAPTMVATPAGTSWDVFSSHDADAQATQLADIQAWNERMIRPQRMPLPG